MTTPGGAAVQIHEHSTSRPASLGGGRLLCIDGPSGSGKTSLAEQLVQIAAATVVHTDQLCPGWDGLPALPAILTGLLTPLAEGRPGRYRDFDWIQDRLARTVVVEPVPLLIIEGVGAGARAISGWTTTLVWLDADHERRRKRAFERDGDDYRDRWAHWAAAEDAFFAAESVQERADLSFRTG